MTPPRLPDFRVLLAASAMFSSLSCSTRNAQLPAPPATRPATALEAAFDPSQYPGTGAINYYFLPHLRPEVAGEVHQAYPDQLLQITWFLHRDRTAARYSVRADGWAFNFRDVYDRATQDSVFGRLSGDRLTRVRRAIAELPPSDPAPPPLQHLVLVSGRRGDEWITRAYDARRIPPAMEDLLEILGERWETRSRRE